MSSFINSAGGAEVGKEVLLSVCEGSVNYSNNSSSGTSLTCTQTKSYFKTDGTLADCAHFLSSSL